MKIVLLVIFVFLFHNIQADQVNALRFKSAFSSNAFLVEDGIDGYQGLGLEYNGIFSVSYEQGDNIISVVENGAENKLFDIVDRFSRLRLSGGYFISPRNFIGVTLPVDQTSTRQPFNIDGDNSGIGGLGFEKSDWILGDIGFKFKRKLLRSDDIWNLTFGAGLYLPTGDEQYFNTDDSIGFAADLSFTRYLNAAHTLRSYGSFGYLHTNNSRLEISDALRVLDTRQRVNIGLGLGYDITPKWNVFGEFAVQISLPFENFQNPLALNLGARYRLNHYQLFAGIGAESMFDSDHSENRFFFGAQYLFGKRDDKEIIQTQNKTKEVYVTKNIISYQQISQGLSLKDLLHFSRGIEFQTGLAEIIPVYFYELDQIGRAFVKHSGQISKIRIVGHTDQRGSKQNNRILSQKRADAIKEYFVSKWNIPEDKFETIGKGSLEPLVKEVDNYSRRYNRRVEFFISEMN